MRSRLLTLMFVGLLCHSAGRAEDWPEFRGPIGQGIATGRYLASTLGIASCLNAKTGRKSSPYPLCTACWG